MEQILNSIIHTLYNWQTLVGALIGAAIPLLIIFFERYLNSRKAEKEARKRLLHELNDQIVHVIDIESGIKDFLLRLDNLIARIEVTIGSPYAIQKTFFPLFSVRTISDDAAKFLFQSGYLTVKARRIFAISSDMPHVIDDVRRQFESTLIENREIALMRLNSSHAHNLEYKMNLTAYSKSLSDDLINKNFTTYIDMLCEAVAILEQVEKTYRLSWVIMFDPKFRYFRNRKAYLDACSNSYEEMDKYFKKFKIQIKERVSRYKT